MAEQDEEPELDGPVEHAGAANKKPLLNFEQMVSLGHIERLHARGRRLEALFAKAIKEGRVNDALAIEKQIGEVLRLIPAPKGANGVGSH